MDVNTLLMNLEDVVGDGFARYSKYIIQDRAIPDARDGLKPVQRRIMYAMFKEGNHFNKPYRKSAKSVGVIIGNYHPHGDSSVYDAMVRLSQDFKLNYPLVDMHGNNGSIDGDSAAAMRYTEARLSPIAMKLLENVDKNTVAFAPNFDDTELEPVVLPAYFPALLINGSTGISAGYATEIPSHNLEEIINATILRIKNPTCELDEVLKIVKGPDFCTGGIIQGKNEIKKAYETGRGRIVVRAKLNVELVKNIKVITISEIPYDVNKADLVRKLEEIKYDKVIDGIIAIRDESDRNGLSIVIELKKEADENLVLNYLYKNTNLQIYYNFNMVAIVNKSPKLLGILPLLDCYINHQKDVLINMTNYELDLSQKRMHIVEGLINAVDVIDEVIQIIRESLNRHDSIENLMSRFNFTKAQAEAIVDLRLYRLSNTDIEVLQEEHEKLLAYIRKLSSILADPKVLNQEIIAKLEEVRDEFKEDRKSIIEDDIEEIIINKEQLIQDSEVMISISKDGYIKRSSMRSYQSSSEDIVRKEDDFIFAMSTASTLDKLLIFFDNGNYAFLPVYEIQETKWKDFGKHINNYVSGVKDEKVVSAILVNDFNINHTLVSVSKSGMIKQSLIKDLELSRYSKVAKYMKLKNDDLICANFVASQADDVILVSKKGYVLRYSLKAVSLTGLKSAGIKAMKLVDDELVSAISCSAFSKEQLYFVFENGQTKRLHIGGVEIGNRVTKGVLYVKNKKTNPDEVLKIFAIAENADLFVTNSQYDVTLLKAYDTPLSQAQEGLKKSIKLENGNTIIDACIISDLHLKPLDENAIKVDILEDNELDLYDYNNLDEEQLALFEEPEE
ncbi:topoisomerase-4 subunit A [Bacilli bacterium PM5-3]|nr:topoisomerase-4 subunit A [Bacilli bacterium PM5-3]MDH6603475.1 topoisomerase-4 subunit A [Bacilli bacterium PM5-9]